MLFALGLEILPRTIRARFHCILENVTRPTSVLLELQQVLQISVQILKYGHRAKVLLGGLTYEIDATNSVGLIVALKVVGV